MDFNSFGLDQQEQQKKLQLAQALQGQAFAPMQARQAGRFVVAPGPLEGVSKIAMALAAKNAGNDAQAAGQRVQQGRGAMLSQALAASQPTPLSEDASGNVTPAQPGNPLKGMEMLARTQDPTLIQMGQPVFAAQQKAAEADEARTFRGQESALNRAERVQRQTSDQDFRNWLQLNKAENDRPFYSPVSTPQGLMAFNARTGQLEPIKVGGKGITKAADDPTLQRDLAGARAEGKESAEVAVAARADLPRIQGNASNALQLVDQLVGSEDGKVKQHPGFKTSVGMGFGRVTKHVPGTDAADFTALLDQVKGGAFLEAFNALKGAGQITEIEGKKGTDAITRMRESQSEGEFIKAAREYQGIVRSALQRAQQKAGAAPSAPYSGPDRRVPKGVDPNLWQHMTEDEKKLWNQ